MIAGTIIAELPDWFVIVAGIVAFFGGWGIVLSLGKFGGRD